MDVISLSSDDSDVEFVCGIPEVKPPLLTSDGTGVCDVSNRHPPRFNNHKNSRRTFPRVRASITPPTSSWTLTDLTECNLGQYVTEPEEMAEPVTPSDVPVETNSHRTKTLHKHGKQKSSSADTSALDLQQDCGNTKTKLKCSQTQNRNCDLTPVVRLKQLSCHEKHVTELESSLCSINITKPDLNTECISNSRTSVDSDYTCRETVNFAEPHIFQVQQTGMNGITSIDDIHVKPHQTSPHSTTPSLSPRLSPSESFYFNHFPHRSSVSYYPECKVIPNPMSDFILAENTSDCHLEEIKVKGTSDNPVTLSEQSPMSVFRGEDMGDGWESGEYRGTDSPLFMVWPEDSDEDNEESRFNVSFRAASQEDKEFVCPLALKKIMSGPSKTLNGLEAKTSEAPKVLCRQSLGLVYITIDENYTEGTLELLSDLIQPGYYPPRDITTHLLHNILLQPQCPHHLCVQAFSLLMRSQRHHRVDTTTVPWDWNLLTTVMANSQDSADRQRCSVIRMFLDYIVQTLEDDFQAKRSGSALNQSIAKSLLSCDQQFSQVRDVIKWLFSAISKSGERKDRTKEGAEPIRIVCSLQRMLSLALEVDQSPALSSVKLSQELFHMLISNVTLRAQRMLLLESLQNTLLRWKLLELLLDYSCPLKTTVPMSLNLLLHFMKNCILAPDSMDGAERWKKWEELVSYLWMLLLGYKATRGSSASEQRARSSSVVFRSEDKLSKPDIHEAVNSFLLRSVDDIGQALPAHVEESLTYLQDYLFEVCQCYNKNP